MKVSQKEFEILSNTDTNQLVYDIWFLSIAPVKDRDLLDSLGRKTALLLQFHDLAQGSGRRAIANAINDLDAMIKGARAVGDPTYSVEAADEARQMLKDALKGDIHYPTIHIPQQNRYQDKQYVIQLVPAFQPHPEFKVTYYAGYVKPPKFAPEETHDIVAAARWVDKEEAQQVASFLLNTLSCVWRVVEA
jgi:hypothetical protein